MTRLAIVAGVVLGLVFVVAAIAEWWALRILGNPEPLRPAHRELLDEDAS